MTTTTLRRGAIGALAGLVTLAGLTLPGQATPAAPLDEAGGVLGWGAVDTAPAWTVPADLRDTAVAAVSAESDFGLVLTAEGRVRVLGETGLPGVSIATLPAGLSGKTVTAIATSSSAAAAVTSDGKVTVWGLADPNGPDSTDVPVDLTGVKDIALSPNNFAVAVKSDGTVVAWGQSTDAGETTVPDGVTGVTSVAVGNSTVYALKGDGTVVAWGSNTTGAATLPAALTTPGSTVKAISARTQGGLALLADGSLASWGQNTTGTGSRAANAVPAALVGKQIVAVGSKDAGVNAAIDSTGVLYTWGTAAAISDELKQAPAGLTGDDVQQISLGGGMTALAVVTDVLPATKAAVSGTPTVGQTLTATPATFSGDPDSVASAWLADGAPIAGAADSTLTLTNALAGKRISVASTATKVGEDDVVSTSDATSAVTADSATSVTATPGSYGGGGTATVTVSNAAGQPVTGTVTLSGAGAPQAASVAGGTATFALPRTIAPGGYTLTASYSGSSVLKPSASAAGYGVAKAKTKRPAFKASKAPTSKKKGKATVTVSTGSGLAKATGKVTVTIKGKSSKTIKTTLSGGKRSISLPKLKKGTYKVTVSYAGDRNYAAQKSSTYKLKIKK
jgi:alpha-tubulin suppressor-like RCC1 family protein